MASRLDILIERFYNKTISEAEHAELLSLLAKDEHARTARKFFKEVLDRQPKDLQHFGAQQSNELLQAIIKKKEPQPVVRWLPVLKWVAAACLLTVLGIWMWKPAYKEDVKTIVETKPALPDLSPGSKNKAVLILADNSKIELDSTGAGILSQQGDAQVTKNASGQIIYKENASTGSAEPIYNILQIPNGGEYQLVLSDGSRVWLNSASTIKFPVHFTGSTREVEISGEAYFEIAKNKERPFKVYFNGSAVEVLGTHFNVNAYDNEVTQAVTLLEGSVKVSKASHEVLIKPGQQATFAQSSQISVKNVTAEDAIAWKNGYFIFVDEDIKSIMRKLSRWYDFKVEYQGNVEDEHFAGMISRFRNISEVLKMFETTGTIQFKIIPGDASGKGKKVVVIK
jgi:transmembrane sensor